MTLLARVKSCFPMILLGLPLCVCFSQQPEQSPTFKARTELVQIPVLVRDKSGEHVSALKQEEFVVLENGAEQKVAFFEEVQSSTERVEFPKSEPDTFTNVLQGKSESKRVTILVLDLLNTQIMDQNYARDQLTKYLAESLDASEPTALFVLTRGGLRMIHDFTSDPKSLVAAVKKMRERHDKPTDSEASQQRDTEPLDQAANNMPELALLAAAIESAQKDFATFQQRSVIVATLQSMQQLARYAKGMPGRKSVVWLTGGFPFSLTDMDDTFSRSTRDSMADVYPLYQSTWQALINANVSLYPVDAQGLLPNASMRADLRGKVGPGGRGAIADQTSSTVDWAQRQKMDTLRVFAQATGGKAFLNNNDLTRGFREAADDSSAYYLVSYYLDRNAKPGWHKVSVKVRHEGVQVRARTGFVVGRPEDDKATQELDTYSALRSPINYTEIPVTFRWTERGTAKDSSRRKIGYEVELPANGVLVDDSNKNRMIVQFLALARNAEGKEVDHPESRKLDMYLSPASLSQIRDSGITYRNAIELPPGDYSVRFVVRDGLSGRMGSVSAALTVEK